MLLIQTPKKSTYLVYIILTNIQDDICMNYIIPAHVAKTLLHC